MVGLYLGYPKRRKKLIRNCKGLTLEVCAGTGRNMKHYGKDLQVVCTDKCEEMLEIAKSKPIARKTQFKNFKVTL